VEELEKSIKAIIKRIDDLKGYSSATTEFLKKEDVLLHLLRCSWSISTQREIGKSQRSASK
jgi:hypothetical protein